MDLNIPETRQRVFETRLGRGNQIVTTEIAADIAVVGACGIDPEFGLSSDSFEEAQATRAMGHAATTILVVISADKVRRRARHRTLETPEIDVIAANASRTQTAAFEKSGGNVDHV